MKTSPFMAFSVAVAFATCWFAGVMRLLAGKEPSPLAHAAILLVPLVACGLIQHYSSRSLKQAVGAAILAPVLATLLVWGAMQAL